jgi:hypothetical protein
MTSARHLLKKNKSADDKNACRIRSQKGDLLMTKTFCQNLLTKTK